LKTLSVMMIRYRPHHFTATCRCTCHCSRLSNRAAPRNCFRHAARSARQHQLRVGAVPQSNLGTGTDVSHLHLFRSGFGVPGPGRTVLMDSGHEAWGEIPPRLFDSILPADRRRDHRWRVDGLARQQTACSSRCPPGLTAPARGSPVQGAADTRMKKAGANTGPFIHRHFSPISRRCRRRLEEPERGS
jgi:hypothetical protein